MNRRHKWLLAVGALGLVGLNLSAWIHAGTMTSWSEGGARTERPEDLGLVDKLSVLATGVSMPRPANRRTPRAVDLEYETLRFENGVGDELEAWHVPATAAPVVAVLFHGHGGQKDSMLDVARALHGLGCSVLLVDFYGSGGSSGSGTTIGIREAHDVRAAVATSRELWPERRVLLYGQSMGGAAILRAIAHLGVEPDGVVLEATFDRLLSTVANRFQRMGLPATPLAQVLTFWGGVRIGANAFAHNPAEYARRVRCPALVLHGGRDRNVGPEQARGISAAIEGWSRLSVYSASGHGNLLATDPERWGADLRAILAELR